MAQIDRTNETDLVFEYQRDCGYMSIVKEDAHFVFPLLSDSEAKSEMHGRQPGCGGDGNGVDYRDLSGR